MIALSAAFRFAVALLPLATLGCGGEEEADVDTSRPAEFGFRKPIQATMVAQGRAAYQKYCIGCHGAQGDGNGAAAGFLDPRPRNFIPGKFKFSSRQVGELPTDDDLRRTIMKGLKGSGMPSFERLDLSTVDALIAYIKTFSKRWTEENPGPSIPIVEDPYLSSADKTEAIQRGEAVYHGFTSCWFCHPAYVPVSKLSEYMVAMGGEPSEGRPNLHEAVPKPNDDGTVLYPPDFRRDFIRSGVSVNDLYRTIGAGLTGSAMPSWIHSIDVPGANAGDPPIVQQSDVWALAYYVQHLISQRPAKLAASEVRVRERPQTIHLRGLPPAAESTEEYAHEAADDAQGGEAPAAENGGS